MFRIFVFFQCINYCSQSYHTLPDCQSTLETTSFLDLSRKDSHSWIKRDPSLSLHTTQTHTLTLLIHTHFTGWCINLIGRLRFQSPQLAQWKVSRIVLQFLNAEVYNGQIKKCCHGDLTTTLQLPWCNETLEAYKQTSLMQLRYKYHQKSP